jgi:hypothetical protein
MDARGVVIVPVGLNGVIISTMVTVADVSVLADVDVQSTYIMLVLRKQMASVMVIEVGWGNDT